MVYWWSLKVHAILWWLIMFDDGQWVPEPQKALVKTTNTRPGSMMQSSFWTAGASVSKINSRNIEYIQSNLNGKLRSNQPCRHISIGCQWGTNKSNQTCVLWVDVKPMMCAWVRKTQVCCARRFSGLVHQLNQVVKLPPINLMVGPTNEPRLDMEPY